MIPTDAKVYEVLALAMRYFFTFFGAMIVWRAFSWLRKDRRLKHRRLKQLPDAGTIGILTVIKGSKQLQTGMVIPVPHEGVLGFLRTCDVVVPVEEVANAHLDFTFVDGKGLYIYPRRGCDATVDGVSLTSRLESQRHPMLHGSVLEIGQAELQLGVFVGLRVPEAIRMPVMPEVPPIDRTFFPEQPEQSVQQTPWTPQAPSYQQPCQQSYPPPPFWQQGPAPQPPYGPGVNPEQRSPYAPPMQPPYGQYPYAPPVNNPPDAPWQGGDGHGQ